MQHSEAKQINCTVGEAVLILELPFEKIKSLQITFLQELHSLKIFGCTV